MESEEEKPIVHMDHRLYHDEPKVILNIYDLDTLPTKVEFSIHRMRGFDDVIQEFRRPPSKWMNHWVKLEYGNPVPLLFDMEGHPYVIAPAKKRPGVKVKVLLKEKHACDILELLQVATDFCDHCNSPLEGSCNQWLEYSEGGGSIADIYVCAYCEKESIRWDTEFLDDHPEMGELKTR